MYQVEEKETRELFTIQYIVGTSIATESVWAYTLNEARQIIADRGYELLD